MIEIHHGDNLEVLRDLGDASFDLVYVDPPFNTGRRRSHARLRTRTDPAGDRTGFGGRRYATEAGPTRSYADAFDDYLAFLAPRLDEAIRVLRADGSLLVHLDPREVHHVKVWLDGRLGRERFQNEIIWTWDYGARSRRRWPAKHDNILWYVLDPDRYTFRYEDVDRIPYLAPTLVGPEKAARGKTPTDVWWQTIVGTNSRERTGYPTQKPLALLERIVRVHSAPGARLLDFFAGSGTFGEAAARHGRDAVLVDDNPQAIEVMLRRLAFADPVLHRRS
jgi:site-specific DNA-methyltransferase (adenine-specific)